MWGFFFLFAKVPMCILLSYRNFLDLCSIISESSYKLLRTSCSNVCVTCFIKLPLPLSITCKWRVSGSETVWLHKFIWCFKSDCGFSLSVTCRTDGFVFVVNNHGYSIWSLFLKARGRWTFFLHHLEVRQKPCLFWSAFIRSVSTQPWAGRSWLEGGFLLYLHLFTLWPVRLLQWKGKWIEPAAVG